MFEHFASSVSSGTPLEFDQAGNPSQRDLEIATAALLVLVGNADSKLQGEEKLSLVRSLGREFKLDEVAGGEMFAIANVLAEKPQVLDQMIEKINQGFNTEQRQLILAMTWRVVLADGKVSLAESSMAASIRAKLGLSIEQATFARTMAEAGEV